MGIELMLSVGFDQENWCVDCSLQCSKTIDWEMAYKLPFCSSKSTKLIIFQFKLLHTRRLATNDFLNKIGIRENDICTFCRTEKESLFHLFWRGFTNGWPKIK